MVRTARSLEINPLPRIQEPAILPMRLAVLLRAAVSRLMESPALMAEALPRAAGRLAGVNYVTVTVSVTSSAVGNPVSSGGTFTFNEGATVYDALCALALSVNAHGSSYGTYVSAIGGLAEKQYGGTSGWMYSVNGTTPMTACSNYVLSNGDNVVWYYVTG